MNYITIPFNNLSLEKVSQCIRKTIEKSDYNTVLVLFNFQFDSTELHMHIRKPQLIELVKIPSSSSSLILLYNTSKNDFYPLSSFKKLQLVIKLIQMDLQQNIDVLNAFSKCLMGIKLERAINSSSPETYGVVRCMYAVYKKRLETIKRIKEAVNDVASEITNEFPEFTKYF